MCIVISKFDRSYDMSTDVVDLRPNLRSTYDCRTSDTANTPSSE